MYQVAVDLVVIDTCKFSTVGMPTSYRSTCRSTPERRSKFRSHDASLTCRTWSVKNASTKFSTLRKLCTQL